MKEIQIKKETIEELTKKINEIEKQIEQLKSQLKMVGTESSFSFGKLIKLNEDKAYFWEGDKLYRAKKIKIRELEGEKEHYYAEQASKEELIELKAKIENLKTIEKRIAIKISWKIIVDKEKINQVKDEIRSIRKIEKLNAEKKELIKKLEEIKIEILKQSNYKCSICGKKIKDINLSVIKDNLIICEKCKWKPEYVSLFKDTLTTQEIIKILNVDKQLLIKAIEFELIKIPINANQLNEIPMMLEEVKKLKFTKEIFNEYLSKIGVKKSWIGELEEKGIIKPVKRVNIEIKRKIIEAKIWNIEEIKAKEKEIIEFIKQKEENKAINKALAREKIKNTLTQLHQDIKKKKEEINQILELLKMYNPILEIMFYLHHLNHYAKTEKYKKYRDEIYDLKEKVLLKAYRENPDLFSVYFIKRGDKIKFCEDCVERAHKEWRNLKGYRGTYMTFGEWLNETTEPCPNCKVEKDYYSLIEFEIDTQVATFNFHLPYPLIKDIFNKQTLKKKHLEPEELFIKFGRSIEKYEALIVPLKRALSKVKKFLNKSE